MKSLRFPRIPAFALAIVIILMLLCPTAVADSAPLGDVNGDSAVSISDYTLIRLHILGLKTLPSDKITPADVNGDGDITISDYTLVRLHILGLKRIGEGGASMPLAGCVIGIDPGHQRHGNYDTEPVAPGSSTTKAKVSSGTQGRFTGVPEYVLNLDVGLKLRDSLEALGATVIMSRTSHDVDISNAARAVMMNDIPVDCWIRIHADGSDDASKHGMHMLVPSGSMNTSDTSVITDSVALGTALLREIIASTGAKDLGLQYRDDQTGFCWSAVPVCTIEMGYMTNENEDNLLATDAYRDKIVKGMVQGFVTYFK
jgi:N-acetylmuramoyl-L-alanine amidase